MPLSKNSEPVAIASDGNFDQNFRIPTTYSTPCLNVATANTIELNEFCNAFTEVRHIHFTGKPKGKIGALLGIDTFAFKHLNEVIPATKNQQFGMKRQLGWTLAGKCERVQKQPEH